MSKKDKSDQSADGSETLAAGVAGKAVPKERAFFRALLASNPNYFGNLVGSSLPPVKAIQNNTTYEEIGCVGFHPQSRRLDAVIFKKLPTGYGGDICTKGSQECVRFYVSYDNGATWVDLGTASCTVYDVPQATPAPQRLEYAVGIPFSPPEKFCIFGNVILVRAILSWDQCPPANQPNWPPIWGEVHNTHIQVQPRQFIPWFELINDLKIKLPAALTENVDLDLPAKAKPAQELSLVELHALYKDKGVEPHRYALPSVQKLLAASSFGGEFAALPPNGLFGEIGIDPNSVIKPLLEPGDGSTYYEQLECVGFNPVTSELIGVLRVKRPNGYSGGPCTAGSREYVTFWADLDGNGTFETCLGVASVQVFDIQNIPGDGLEYSVYLPVNFSKYWQSCGQGPRQVPIRAILSWASPVPCPNPNQPPVWGNHEDTLILLPPGDPVHPGDFSPVLFNISTVAVCDISQATGLAAGDRPFGGSVYIVGDIPAADSLTAPDTVTYKLWVRQPPSLAWQPIANDFSVSLDQLTGGVLTQFPFTQSVNGAGAYTYRDYGIGTGTWRRLAAPYSGLLGVWQTGQPLTGQWEIRVEAFHGANTYAAAVTHCPDMSTRQNVIVTLDEVPPTVDIAITDYSTDNGASWHPAADCAKFAPGVWIRGSYSVADDHLGQINIVLEPAPANGNKPGYGTVPPPPPFVNTGFPRTYHAPTTGEVGTWSLDTSNMPTCGYVLRIDAYDRTIVSANGGWSASKSVGFCLTDPSGD
jgi:hypothetical protein